MFIEPAQYNFSDKIILLSGRPSSGKTEMLIAYANQFPKTTLIISEEYTQKEIVQIGLNESVTVIGVNEVDSIDFDRYKTVCFDYLELFDIKYIKDLIGRLMYHNHRIVLVTQMTKNYKINNIFLDETLGL